jgi:glycosyltransferase involved in cell wall biosynthesis
MSIKVLMLGWEFPPFISGGLGTACYGLTRAMENMNVNITMLLPIGTWGCEGNFYNCFELQAAEDENPANITFRPVPSELPNPYTRSHTLSQPLRLRCAGSIGGYDGNLAERVDEYAKHCTDLIEQESYDVIHAHDWVTFPAGIALSAKLSKPLVVHVHATEFDRSGSYVNDTVYEIERKGMEAASLVIAVSQYTSDILVERYAVPRHKIRIVHNGIIPKPPAQEQPVKRNGQRIVLFLGRITGQKGPYHFIDAAEKTLARLKNVKFVVAGWGDLAPAIIERVAAKRLGSKILFTGFLRGGQVDRAYRTADVYVMPSVSEPFGLTAVEAVQQGVPVILSKTTGVGEILDRGAVKIDFWDAEKIAETIVKILSDHELAEKLTEAGREEIRFLTWEAAASKCLTAYQEAMAMANLPGVG